MAGPSQAIQGLGALLGGGASAYSNAYNQARQNQMQNAYMQALYGQKMALQDPRLQAQRDIADQNNQLKAQLDAANNAEKLKAAGLRGPAGGQFFKPDVITSRRIIGSGNYQDVANKYIDLYNQYNNTTDPAQRQTLAQQMLAHGPAAPVNTWIADTPDQTPEERAAGQKVNELSQKAQQLGYGEQLRFMHAMETLNQQTGGARPPNPAAVQHVYDTTPGLDAPNNQFAAMMQGQIDSSVPWKGMIVNAKMQGKDSSPIEAQQKQYAHAFHQVSKVPYDEYNQPQTTDFGYGQSPTNGVKPLGSPSPTPQTSPAPATGGPKPGDIENGYRFKGGSPSDQSAWELAQ